MTESAPSDRAAKGRIDGALELIQAVGIGHVALLVWREPIRAKGLLGAAAVSIVAASIAAMWIVVRTMLRLRRAGGPVGRERAVGIRLRAAGLALAAVGAALAVHGCLAARSLWIGMALAAHFFAYVALFLGARL